MNPPAAVTPIAVAAVPVAVTEPAYRRILLKLSGEALMGADAYGINREGIDGIVAEIAEVTRLGVEVAIVIGGGNIFRGVAPGAAGMDRATAAYLGMLAPLMKALARHERPRRRRRQHLPRCRTRRGGHGPRDRRLHGHARDADERARAAGRASSRRRRV